MIRWAVSERYYHDGRKSIAIRLSMREVGRYELMEFDHDCFLTVFPTKESAQSYYQDILETDEL